MSSRELPEIVTSSLVASSLRIHDRFLRDSDFRASQLEHDRDEDVCLKWDDIAEQDFTNRMRESEYFSIQTELEDLSQ